MTQRFYIIFLSFIISTVSHAQFSVGFSLPHGFEGGLENTISESAWSLRLGIGGWPLERAWPTSLAINTDLGDSYSSSMAPRVFIVNSSMKAIYRSSPDSTWSWLTGLDLWMIHAGALVFLKNRDTNEKVMIAELNGRWWQPIFSIGTAWTFSKTESTQWDLEMSLGILFGGALKSEILGPLPALQKVAPEYSDALEEGSQDAEENLSGAINDALKVFPVMPSIGIRYKW